MIDKKLTLASAKLARAAPQFWAEFTQALAAQTSTHVNALISSPPEQLPLAQGRAQSMTALLSLLETCIKDADQTIEKAKK